MWMTAAEVKYYKALKELECCTTNPKQQKHELGLVGARLGEGITNTCKLKVLGYNETMAQPDKTKWDESIGKEHK